MRAIAGIEVILEERAKVDFFKGVFLFDRGNRILFWRCRCRAFAVFLFLAHLIKQRDSIFEFLENRVLDHLGVDHVLELKLVERKNRHHLHQPRGEDLALR